MATGVVGVNVWNFLIIGIIAVVFLIIYNYVQKNYAQMLPVA